VSTEEVRAHYVERFGPPSRIAEYSSSSHDAWIYKWNSDATAEGANLYVTIGASACPISGYPTDHRLEFHLGLLPAMDDVTASLAAMALRMAETGIPIDHGHTFSLTGPLWRGTPMQRLLVFRSPGEEIIAPLKCSDGSHVSFLQAAPIHECEVEFRDAHGIDELLRVWSLERVPFWDPFRPPPELP
jgi:Suppressor of fused protein (SUFU)